MADTLRSRRRINGMRIAAVLLASTLTYVLAEIGFRVYRHHQLARECMEYFVLLKQSEDGAVVKMPWHPASQFNEFSLKFHQLARYDKDVGYRLCPNTPFHCKPANLAARIWSTNSHGHIADREYPRAKPADEFRIVTLGDSFTMGENNAVRWQPFLEERLNGNPRWRRFVGGKVTRVINLGMSGIGVGQFKAVFDFEGRRFEPDVTLVNFVVDDLKRRWYAIGKVDSIEQAERHIRENVLGRLPWYRIYPELIAETDLGTSLGLKSGLHPQLSRYHDSDAESVRVSAEAIAHIAAHGPRMLLCLHPSLAEVKFNRLHANDVELMASFEEAIAPVQVCYMRDHLRKLRTEEETYASWYQFPHDPHPSDLGQVKYAAALELALVEFSASFRLPKS